MNKFLLTMQYNEYFLMPIFIRHYNKYFSLNNIFVIDHGSDSNLIPPGVNRIYVPRDRPFSEVDRLNLIKHISAGLLKYYDYGVYADSDEFIALEYLCEDKLKDTDVIYVAGFDVYIDKDKKDLIGLINPHECKPLIYKTVPNWGVGFHSSNIQFPSEKLEIPMAHVRYLFPDEITERFNIRRMVFQSMKENEKKAGLDFHWQEGLTNFKEFARHAMYLKDTNSFISSFNGIDRDKLFNKVKTTNPNGSIQYIFKQKGGYELLKERYLLTALFPELI